jgi:competence protein ComEC
MSGASPSVVRAALMFSVLQLIKNSTVNYNPMNALAVVVFVMLFCNPQTLYDISFQLSVLAVAGIVAWGGPIVRSLKIKSRIAASVTSTFVIGVVATLWTMPVVSATFDNIPVVGVVATPVVLLTAYVIVGCGVMTLLLPHPLSLPFAYCAEWCASLQNMVVEWFASLPFASVEHTLSPTTIAIYYAVFVVVTLILWSRKAMRAQRAFTLSELEK